MYKVTVVAVNETIEVEVDAKHCVVDDKNNLVFLNSAPNNMPDAMFPAGRWVLVVKG